MSLLFEGKTSGRIANTVFANLDSDLPLVVWWQADLTQNFEERFYSRIDTLIIDSSRWSDPAFPAAFPWFNTVRYWGEQILELREQVAALDEPPLELE